MVCRKCGQAVADDSVYCSSCGCKLRSSGEGKKKLPLVLAAAVLCLVGVLVYNLAFSPVVKAEKAIDAIGTVTMSSLEQILLAEEAYEGLSSSARAKVENRAQLTDARTTYDRMVQAIETASRAIEEAKAVTYRSDGSPCVDPEDRYVVEDARKAYDVLEAEGLTDYVSAQYEDLEAAELGLANVHGSQLYQQALEAAKKGDHKEAIDGYRHLLYQYPNYPEAQAVSANICASLNAMAKAEKNKGDLEEARDLYSLALNEDPQNQEALDGAMSCVLKVLDTEFKAGNLETVERELDAVYQMYGSTKEYEAYREKLQKKLDGLRPRNGQVLDKKMKWGQGTFTVDAGDRDALIKLELVSDPSKYVTFYVHANNSATVNVADGEYVVKYAVGETWYGKEAYFGGRTVFTKADDTMSFETTYSGSYVYFSTISITLYTVVGGDLTTSEIPADTF